MWNRASRQLVLALLTALGISLFAGAGRAQDGASLYGSPGVEGVKALLQRAKGGDANAKTELAAAFGARTIPPGDFDDVRVAEDYYRFGAALGDGRALYFLGNLHCGRKGQDTECERLHRLAAGKGDAEAMSSLSARFGHGAQKDPEQAKYWQQRAAEAGHGRSMLYLARRYEEGDGVERDPQKAAYWYERAEAAGERTPAVLRRENEACAARMRRGAQDGDTDAMFALARSYANGGFYGCGLKQDYDEAIRWYSEAAQRGHAVSANNLGALFGRGLGVARDFKKAMHWYEFAARKGFPRAMLNVAAMFKQGDLGEVDLPAAVAWYRLVTEHLPGNPRDWPLEELERRTYLRLIMEPCVLRGKMTEAQWRSADDQLAVLSAQIPSPVTLPARLSNSSGYQDACRRAGG